MCVVCQCVSVCVFLHICVGGFIVSCAHSRFARVSLGGFIVFVCVELLFFCTHTRFVRMLRSCVYIPGDDACLACFCKFI